MPRFHCAPPLPPSFASDQEITAATTSFELEELYKQASELKDSGKYQEALIIWKRILKTNEDGLGRDNSITAIAIRGLAGSYFDIGDNEKAESLYLESLSITEKDKGSNSSLTAMSLRPFAKIFCRYSL